MIDNPDFDPNAASAGDDIFGLPPRDDALLRVLGVPFEATCSYGGGTHDGPELIRAASLQVDLLDAHFGSAWQHGIRMENLESGPSRAIADLDRVARSSGDPAKIEELSQERTDLVRSWTREQLEAGRIPAILGGDHSCPLGAIAAAADGEKLSILHFDAHHDLRDAFEGVRESHASILRNVLEDCPHVECVVQLGIRDYCDEEYDYAKQLGARLRAHYAADWSARRFRGEHFAALVDEALAPLGKRVWITFDIDGLTPDNCPGTGTPVPGGLSFEEACFVLTALAESDRRLVGFDLCEVAGSEWDGNVGARLLYKLCGLAAQTNSGDRTWN